MMFPTIIICIISLVSGENSTELMNVPNLIIVKNQPSNYIFKGFGSKKIPMPDYSFNRVISNLLIDTGCASWHGATRTDLNSYIFYEIGNRGQMSVGKNHIKFNDEGGKLLIYTDNDSIMEIQNDDICDSVLQANLLTFKSFNDNKEENERMQRINNIKIQKIKHKFMEFISYGLVFFIPYYFHVYNFRNRFE